MLFFVFVGLIDLPGNGEKRYLNDVYEIFNIVIWLFTSSTIYIAGSVFIVLDVCC